MISQKMQSSTLDHPYHRQIQDQKTSPTSENSLSLSLDADFMKPKLEVDGCFPACEEGLLEDGAVLMKAAEGGDLDAPAEEERPIFSPVKIEDP